MPRDLFAETAKPKDLFAMLPANNNKINYNDYGLDKAGGRGLSFANGATFGFGDEATAGLLSGLSKIGFLDMPVNYEDALNTARGIEKGYSSNHPVESLGLSLSGGLATGILGGGTAKAGSLANSLRTGNLAARTAKGALSGAAAGGLYGFGSGEGGLKERASSAGKGAAFGGLVGGAIPLTGAALNSLKSGAGDIVRGIRAKDSEALTDSIERVGSEASLIYSEMRAIGDTLKSGASSKLIENIDNALQKEMPFANPMTRQAVTPKTLAYIDDIKSAVDSGKLGVSDIDYYRRFLSRMGGSGEEQNASRIVKSALDKTLDSLSGDDLASGSTKAIDLLNSARKTSAKGFRYQDIAEILKTSGGDPNKIKSGLTRFLNNNPSWGSDAERTALKAAANSSTIESIYKGLGRFGFEPKNVFLPLVGGATTTALFGGPAGAALTVAGTAARQAQKYLARGKAENLLRAVEQSGVGQAIPEQAANQGILAATVAAPSISMKFKNLMKGKK